jgi:hypothetical protein
MRRAGLCRAVKRGAAWLFLGAMLLPGCAGPPGPLATACRDSGLTLADGTTQVMGFRVATFVDAREGGVLVARLFGVDNTSASHAFRARMNVTLNGTLKQPFVVSVGEKDFATGGEAGPYCDFRFDPANFGAGGSYAVTFDGELADGRVLHAVHKFEYIVART